MIVVKAQMTIAPDARNAFLEHMDTLVQTSRAEEGCISFACYEDVTATNAFIVLAEWRDQAALDQHESAAHLARFKTSIGSMIVSRQPTQVYTVSHVGGLNPAPQS